MPQFFNLAELTHEQKARWDASILEYTQVQECNVELRFAALSDKERAYYAEKHNAITDEEIKSKFKQFCQMTGNPPGHSKSALFARLLDGLPALPFPPPTSYSYPWYGVIEDKGPHRVMIGGAMSFGSLVNGTGGAKSDVSIGINQCLWSVVGSNEAAKVLLELDGQLERDARKPDPNSEFSAIYDWPEDLLQRVKDAYALGPEFLVKHGSWPAYRLFVTQLNGEDDCHRSQKKYAKEKMRGGVSRLTRTGSVFDLDALLVNARIGKTISKGTHPLDRLEETKRRQAESAKEGSNLGPFLKSSLDLQLVTLDADVRDFEENPDNEDWVEVFTDRWYLERVEEEVHG